MIVILVGLFMITRLNGLFCGWNCCSHEHISALNSTQANSCCAPAAFVGNHIHSEKKCHCVHHIMDNLVYEPLEVIAALSLECMANTHIFDLEPNHPVILVPQDESISAHWQIKRWRVPISGAEIRIFLSSFLN